MSYVENLKDLDYYDEIDPQYYLLEMHVFKLEYISLFFVNLLYFKRFKIYQMSNLELYFANLMDFYLLLEQLEILTKIESVATNQSFIQQVVRELMIPCG